MGMPAASTEPKETAVLPEAEAVGTKPDKQSAAVNEADNLPAAVGEAVADDASNQAAAEEAGETPGSAGQPAVSESERPSWRDNLDETSLL